MKMVLRRPPVKGWILFFEELAGDEEFQPTQLFMSVESERAVVNQAICRAVEPAGLNIFNQCRWRGTSGWEFWSSDEAKILDVCISVADELQSELLLEDCIN